MDDGGAHPGANASTGDGPDESTDESSDGAAEPEEVAALAPTAAASDSAEGYGALYRRAFRPLLGMAVALVGSRRLADDAVQRAFAWTFERYDRLPDPEAAARRAVLRNCAGERPEPDDPARPTERVLSRVRSLPRPQRDVVALLYSLELDLDEVDHTLELAQGTAAERLAEAATGLRGALEVGDALDVTLLAAFAERRSELGALIARPGEAQRRVYRRRRIKVAAIAGAVAVGLALAFRFIGSGGDGGEDLSAGTTEGPAATTATSASTSTPTTAGDSTSTVPSTTAGITAAPTAGSYTVVEGDGWYAIAEKLDVPVESLLAVNGATLSSSLFVGQELLVPPPAT